MYTNCPWLKAHGTNCGPFFAKLLTLNAVSDPFPAGIYYGHWKVHETNVFLRPFVCDLDGGLHEGFVIGNRNFQVQLSAMHLLNHTFWTSKGTMGTSLAQSAQLKISYRDESASLNLMRHYERMVASACRAGRPPHHEYSSRNCWWTLFARYPLYYCVPWN